MNKANPKFQYIGKVSRDAKRVQKRAEKWRLVLAKFNEGRRDAFTVERLKRLRTRNIAKKNAEV